MLPKPRKILGIDPGTVVTGYGVIEELAGKVSYVDSGVVRPGRKGTMPERLAVIHRGITALIHTYAPDVVVVEEAFYGDNPKTAIKLGQARGVALVVAALNDTATAEYAPRTIKQTITGSGRADKAQVKYMVTRILNLPAPPEPDDASDALAAAICCVMRQDLPKPDPAETAATLARLHDDPGLIA
jgi:crossover junction endodeoxyribonuclease RuvC